MNISIIYQHYLRPGEAGHNRFNEFARVWSGLGHRVSVITGQASYMTGLKDPSCRGRLCVRERDGDVDVYRMYVPDRANGSFVRRGASYLAFAASGAWGCRLPPRPSVLVCSSPPLFAGLAMLAVRRFSRVPLVFEVRDLWPGSAAAAGVALGRRAVRWMYDLERRCYRAAGKVNVLTEAFRDDIVARGLADPSKIIHVPNGVDTESQRPGLRCDRLRGRMGWSGRFVVLYSGAHGVANRVGQLLDAAELLRDRPEILIATVGGGMELEGLRERARARGLTNVALYGPRPREEMPALTASADACVAVLRRHDTFRTVYPNKVFEAMACGRPLVVAIDGAARALVERAGAGLFAEPEDPRALADAVLRLHGDPDAASAMGRGGRRYVVEHYDRTALALRYLDELRAVARP